MIRHMASAASLSLRLPLAGTGAVIHVPGDQPTIQTGVNAAGTIHGEELRWD